MRRAKVIAPRKIDQFRCQVQLVSLVSLKDTNIGYAVQEIAGLARSHRAPLERVFSEHILDDFLINGDVEVGRSAPEDFNISLATGEFHTRTIPHSAQKSFVDQFLLVDRKSTR